LRRLAGLLLFGLLHIVLLWDGDILLIYAVTGVLLLLFRKRAPRTQLIWACALLAVMLTVYTLANIGLAVAGDATRELNEQVNREFATARSDAIRTALQTGYWDSIAKRIATYGGTVVLLITRIPTVLAMFLIGLWAGRIGLFSDVDAHTWLWRRARTLGWLIGLPSALLVAFGYFRLNGFQGIAMLFFNQGFAGPVLAAGYIATIVLALRGARWRTVLAPLASVGRMALTNYLAQSLICALLFNGYGLGLIGQVGPLASGAIAAGVFALQIAVSRIWLSRFAFGPLEWLWRSITYGALQPITHGAPRNPGALQ
jgi:uncharacterized protein